MTLTQSIDEFAERLAEEFNAVRSEIAAAVDTDEPPVTLTATGGVITPDASTGSVFRHAATANVTLTEPTGGVDGQAVTVAVLASGAARTLTVAGVGSVSIPSGRWWVGELRYDAATSTWLLDDTAGHTVITTGGGGGGGASVSYVDAADQALDGRLDVLEARPVLDSPDDIGAAPAAHEHTIGDVTGLQAALDGKAEDADVTALDGRVDALEAVPSGGEFAILGASDLEPFGGPIPDGHVPVWWSGYNNGQGGFQLRSVVNQYQRAVIGGVNNAGSITTSPWTPNAQLANDHEAAIGADIAVGEPANGTDSQRLTLVMTATGAARAITLAAAIETEAGVSRTLTVPAGEVATAVMRRFSTRGKWVCSRFSALTVPAPASGGVGGADLAGRSPRMLLPRPRVGDWVAQPASAVTQAAVSVGGLTLGWNWLPPGTYGEVAFHVNAAAPAGSLLRVVAYADDNGRPGVLLADCGTVATTAAGMRNIAGYAPLVVPDGGLGFWAGGVAQGAAGCNPFLVTGNPLPIASAAAPALWSPGAVGAFSLAGVTGAPPADGSAFSAVAASVLRLGWRRTA